MYCDIQTVNPSFILEDKGENMNDKQIVELYLKRLELAITETKKKYGTYIRTIAMNILKSNEDTDECENDTYFLTWNSIPPKEPENLKLFVGRIARNGAISIYRKKTAEKRGGGMEILLSELSECVPDKDFSPVESSFMAMQLSTYINNFLQAQPQEKRVVFVKRYWYGKSISEISAETGMTESNVSTTLFRMRGGLKEILSGGGISV